MAVKSEPAKKFFNLQFFKALCEFFQKNHTIPMPKFEFWKYKKIRSFAMGNLGSILVLTEPVVRLVSIAGRTLRSVNNRSGFAISELLEGSKNFKLRPQRTPSEIGLSS